MSRLLLMCVCCGLLASGALAADPYEEWLIKQSNRGIEIELIRVASQKQLVAIEESDSEVASILDEVEALEDETDDHEIIEDSE